MLNRFSLFVLLAVAGCDATPGPDVDAENETAFADGEGTGTNPCVRNAILSLVNDSSTNEGLLKWAGLHTQAARSIMAIRSGEDGKLGTSDDVVFESLSELDNVPYVGPVAFDALIEYGLAECDGATSLTGEACIVSESLRLLNNSNVDAETLVKAGVYRPGANALVDTRNGADRTPGTSDDIVFSDFGQVDAVAQVGSASIEALRGLGDSVCTGADQVVFSPQEYADSHLTRVKAAIENTEETIDIAMYSFRDADLRDALENAVQRGVGVRILFHTASSDRKSPAGTWSAALEDAGIEVRWINKIMHHKFALIDGPRNSLQDAKTGLLISGSGNWSHSAGTRYDENTFFVAGDEKLNLAFQQEFNLLWENGRDVVWNETISSIGHVEITDLDVSRAAGTAALFTSDNFRTYISSTYGPTFTLDGDQRTVSDGLVDLIESAEHSIYIASGHMRSRPVAAAVIESMEKNPDLDVRVYLDGQEYISSWYHGQQTIDYNECLNTAAGDTDARQECLDEGYYFGYGLHLAGVPTRYKYYSYRWHYSYAAQMHHKYVLVDERILATGSYNLSNNAEQNTMENVALFHVSDYPTLISSYRRNFEKIWVTGEAEGHYESIVDEISNGNGDSFPIVFDSMALDWSDVAALKSIIRDNCPDINSESFRKSPEKHWSCSR